MATNVSCESALERSVAQRDDYIRSQEEVVRCKMQALPPAFPQIICQFPNSWKLIHYLIYDFLKRLKLTNTMSVFAVESEFKSAMNLLESGWFTKSFVMSPDFHSLLMLLLQQFASGHCRIEPLLNEQIRAVQCEQSQQSLAEAEENREREQMLEGAEEDRRAMERVCAESRAKIISGIQERHSELERSMQDSYSRKREMSLRAEEDRNSMEMVVKSARKRILEGICQRNDSLDRGLNCSGRRRPLRRAGSAEGRVEWKYGAKTRRPVAPVDPDEGVCSAEDEEEAEEAEDDELALMTSRPGCGNYGSRRRSLGNFGSSRSAYDRRANQSFRQIDRNQHPGGRIEPLGSFGGRFANSTGGAEVVLENSVRDQVVVEAVPSQPDCSTRSTRPSLIPRISHLSRTTQRRASCSTVHSADDDDEDGDDMDAGLSLAEQAAKIIERAKVKCACQQASARRRAERLLAGPNAVHFSRRSAADPALNNERRKTIVRVEPSGGLPQWNVGPSRYSMRNLWRGSQGGRPSVQQRDFSRC